MRAHLGLSTRNSTEGKKLWHVVLVMDTVPNYLVLTKAWQVMELKQPQCHNSKICGLYTKELQLCIHMGNFVLLYSLLHIYILLCQVGL